MFFKPIRRAVCFIYSLFISKAISLIALRIIAPTSSIEYSCAPCIRSSSTTCSSLRSLIICFRVLRLFIVSPHAQYFYDFFCLINFINQSMLDIDSSRKSALVISLKFFDARRCLIRIDAQYFYQRLCLIIQFCCLQVLNIFDGWFRVLNPIHHHSTSSSGMHSLCGVRMPSRIFSSIPGIEERYKVSIRPL